jgi:transposase
MGRFIEEADRGQWTLLPECLDDFIDESNPVRVIDVFVDALDLAEMSFEGGGAGDARIGSQTNWRT